MVGRVWNLYVNVDGASARTICPLPHAPLGNIEVDRATVERWDLYSCWDRYQEIRDQLSLEEAGLLEALLVHLSGTTALDRSSFWDVIRSHALFAHNPDNFEEVWFKYKLRAGQSTLARRMLSEAVETGLNYSFSTPIETIIDHSSEDPNGLVELRTKHGSNATRTSFRARRVISTIPLNVLHDIQFIPPVSALRREAFETGHVNRLVKIHAEVEGSGLASWNGLRYPNLLQFGYGDGVLPNGHAHLVAFGDDDDGRFRPQDDPKKVVEALQQLHPMDVQRMARV